MTTSDTATTLAAKLDALELTAAEHALLHTLIGAADDSEVAGYARISFGELIPKLGLVGDDVGVLVVAKDPAEPTSNVLLTGSAGTGI